MLGGAEVAVRHGQLVIRGQVPVPAVRRGLRLYPDGDDPYAFRAALPGYGSGTTQVVFSREPGGEVTALHLGVMPMSFARRPGSHNPRRWATGALAAGAGDAHRASPAPPPGPPGQRLRDGASRRPAGLAGRRQSGRTA